MYDLPVLMVYLVTEQLLHLIMDRRVWIACGFVAIAAAAWAASIQFASRRTRLSATTCVTLAQLPPGAVCYKTAPADAGSSFSRETIPRALLNRHNTKVGVWGKIVCDRGRIRIQLLGEGRADAVAESAALRAGEYGVVNPQQYHFVELLTDDALMHVEFHRLADASPSGTGLG